MATILVTLEVSKCSGWLNDDAPCKAGRRAHYIRCRARCPGVERVGREGVWGGAERRESRRAERTANMAHMSVTLDVLNVSGWLNADASCQGEGIYDVGRHL